MGGQKDVGGKKKQAKRIYSRERFASQSRMVRKTGDAQARIQKPLAFGCFVDMHASKVDKSASAPWGCTAGALYL